MLLEEFLQPLQLSQNKAAQLLGISFPRLNEIVRGERPVTLDTALRLEKLFAMPAEFWLTLQLRWDVWHAQRGKPDPSIAKITPILRRRPVRKAAR
jgi:addiction module HigA family antidote